MNFLSIKSESLFIASGVIAGAVGGGLTNLARSGSFFSHDAKKCLKPFSFNLFNAINNFRENEFFNGKSNPFYSVIHLGPTFGFALWNIFFQRNPENPGIIGRLKNGGHQILKGVICPSIHSTTLTLMSFAIRNCTKKYFLSLNIDTSGHALAVGAMMISAISSFNSVKEQGTSTQVKVYKLILGTVALTDAIWMFNTTANCHSVGDVACGAAMLLVSESGIQLSKFLTLKMFSALKQMSRSLKNKIYSLSKYQVTIKKADLQESRIISLSPYSSK